MGLKDPYSQGWVEKKLNEQRLVKFQLPDPISLNSLFGVLPSANSKGLVCV